MKVVGIAAEYNPFHLGHAYQISEIRRRGADAVVAVMSGNFVQRGECAVMDKFARAEAAVACGVDLVVCLPVSYAVASAPRFADGCVKMLSALGCVDEMNFGSECGDLARLERFADADLSITPDEWADEMATGVSYARARSKILARKGFGDLSLPNDILAVEYIKAIRKNASPLAVSTVLRRGSFHEGGDPDGFEGAEAIRHILARNPDAGLGNLMPEGSIAVYEREKRKGRAPVTMENLERAILSFWRSADPSTLSNVRGMTEGLEYRIAEAALHAVSLSDLYDRVKTKRYTMSAVRRAVLSAYLGIAEAERGIPYVQVPAFNKTGETLLKTMKKTCALPVIHNLTPVLAADERFSSFVREECRAADLFALAMPEIHAGYGEFTHKTERPV